MTAQIINKNFNKTIETDKRLREFCFGTLEGITRDKITQEIWDDFNKNPKKFNAETKEEIFNRIKSFIDDIKSNNINKNTLVVTHGGSIRMIKYYLDNGDNYSDKKYLEEYMNLKINNLDLFIIDEKMNLKKYDLEKYIKLMKIFKVKKEENMNNSKEFYKATINKQPSGLIGKFFHFKYNEEINNEEIKCWSKTRIFRTYGL